MLVALRYPASFEETKGTIVVRFRDLPEALSEASDRASAFDNAVDCLDAALHFRMKDGGNIPAPSLLTEHDVSIVPTTETCMRVALYQSFRASGLSVSDFAQRIAMDPVRFHEIISTHRPFDFRKVGDALRSLGKPIVLSIDAA